MLFLLLRSLGKCHERDRTFQATIMDRITSATGINKSYSQHLCSPPRWTGISKKFAEAQLLLTDY